MGVVMGRVVSYWNKKSEKLLDPIVMRLISMLEWPYTNTTCLTRLINRLSWIVYKMTRITYENDFNPLIWFQLVKPVNMILTY